MNSINTAAKVLQIIDRGCRKVSQGGYDMNRIKANLPSFIMFILEAAVGILLLINPIGFTSAIIRAVGIGMAVGGAIWGIKYFRTEAMEAAASGMLFSGLLCLLIGLVLIFKTEWLINTFNVIIMLYGVMIVLLGILKLQWTTDLIRMKRERWVVSGLSALIAIIFGALILFNPFKTNEILWSLAGAALLAQAIFDIIALFACPRVIDIE